MTSTSAATRRVRNVRHRSGARPANVPTWVVAGVPGAVVAAFAWQPMLILGLFGIAGALRIVHSIVQRPVLAARIMVIAGPLLVGLERGSIAGPLRANELLLALVGLAVVFSLLFRTAVPPTWRRCDTAVAALFFTGTLLPLLLAFGRGRGPSVDDVLSAFTLAKGVALYGVVRVVHGSRDDVWRTARLSIIVASTLAVVGVLDALNVGGLSDFLARFWPSTVGTVVDDARASATIGNSIGLGGYLVLHLALAIPFSRSRLHDSRLHPAFAAALLLGVLATGQISAWIGLVAVVTTSIMIDRPHPSPRVVLAALGIMLLAATVLWPVAARRTEGFAEQVVPSWKLDEIATLDPHLQSQELYYAAPGSSWDVRRYNLETYFLPDLLKPTNLIFGVRPEARVVPREPWLDYVWIESGVLWLFYVGGVPLATAFGFLLWRFFAAALSHRTDRNTRPFAEGLLGLLPALSLLMLFDPHLTLRGSSEALFPLLALSVVAFGWGDSARRQTQAAKVRS